MTELQAADLIQGVTTIGKHLIVLIVLGFARLLVSR